jgi:hypothetical protein
MVIFHCKLLVYQSYYCATKQWLGMEMDKSHICI